MIIDFLILRNITICKSQAHSISSYSLSGLAPNRPVTTLTLSWFAIVVVLHIKQYSYIQGTNVRNNRLLELMSIFLYMLFDYQIGWIAYKKIRFRFRFNLYGSQVVFWITVQWQRPDNLPLQKISDGNDWIVLHTHYPTSPNSWIENYTTSSIIVRSVPPPHQ